MLNRAWKCGQVVRSVVRELGRALQTEAAAQRLDVCNSDMTSKYFPNSGRLRLQLQLLLLPQLPVQVWPWLSGTPEA